MNPDIGFMPAALGGSVRAYAALRLQDLPVFADEAEYFLITAGERVAHRNAEVSLLHGFPTATRRC